MPFLRGWWDAIDLSLVKVGLNATITELMVPLSLSSDSSPPRLIAVHCYLACADLVPFKLGS